MRAAQFVSCWTRRRSCTARTNRLSPGSEPRMMHTPAKKFDERFFSRGIGGFADGRRPPVTVLSGALITTNSWADQGAV